MTFPKCKAIFLLLPQLMSLVRGLPSPWGFTLGPSHNIKGGGGWEDISFFKASLISLMNVKKKEKTIVFCELDKPHYKESKNTWRCIYIGGVCIWRAPYIYKSQWILNLFLRIKGGPTPTCRCKTTLTLKE
jgi:hypothetical protein